MHALLYGNLEGEIGRITRLSMTPPSAVNSILDKEKSKSCIEWTKSTLIVVVLLPNSVSSIQSANTHASLRLSQNRQDKRGFKYNHSKDRELPRDCT